MRGTLFSAGTADAGPRLRPPNSCARGAAGRVFFGPKPVGVVYVPGPDSRRIHHASAGSAVSSVSTPVWGCALAAGRPTLTGPEEADKFVRKLLHDGADYMKIMIEDGSLVYLDLPVLSRETVRALTREMHRRGKLAVAHVIELDRAFDLLHDGVDGLVHMPVDQVAPANFIRLAVMKGIFVVPTLAVEESFITTEGGAEVIADPDLGPYLTPEEKAWLLGPFPPSLITQQNLEFARESVRLLHEAGVPILAGTDMATHGVSLHRDLELMVRAGLDPVDALAAATSNPAAAWGFADRGRIAPGLRADLFLVQGDPTTDIKATRKIQRIWKAGVEVDRPLPAPAAASHTH